MSRNIFKDYIDYDKKCISDYISSTMGDVITQKNINNVVDAYINARYYDNYEHIEESNVNNVMYYVKKSLLDNIKDKVKETRSDEVKNNLSNTLWIIKYILYFEKARGDKKISKLLDELEEKVKKRFNTNEDVKKTLFPIIKEKMKYKEDFLKKCSCKDFTLEVNKTNVEKTFYTKLISNVKMPDLFSQYAINRVYNQSIVNEDKLYVTYTLVNINILNDILKFEYDKKYVVPFDKNLLNKGNKIRDLFHMFDLDVLKDRACFEIKYEDFVENKDKINEYIHNGYKFAILINDSFCEPVEVLGVFEYVILDGKLRNMPRLKKTDNVILWDQIGE